MSSDEQVQALLMVNKRQIDGTLQKIKVRKAEVLLSVIEVFNFLEDLMLDREELAVCKGPEARTNTVGAEREGANVALDPLPQAQTRGGGSNSSRGGSRNQDSSYVGDPLTRCPNVK